jgi:hypothetical protein
MQSTILLSIQKVNFQKFFLPVLFLVSTTVMHGQILERQLISTTGNLSQTDELMVSATGGETIIHTAIAGEIMLTQGFQQPTAADFVGIWQIDDLSLNITVAPNPVTTAIHITLNAERPIDLSVTVFGMDGTMAVPQQKLKVSGEMIKRIDFSTLPAGTYLLTLQSKTDKSSQTFKIIKQW